MKSYLLVTLISLVGITGCGASTSYRDTGVYEKYVQSFEKASIQQGYGVYVNFIKIQEGELEEGTLGVCSTSSGMPTITISPKYWPDLSETERTILLYHELGHCVLYKVHNNGDNPTGSKRAFDSIMNAYPLDLYDFDTYYNEYTKELFNPSLDE